VEMPGLWKAEPSGLYRELHRDWHDLSELAHVLGDWRRQVHGRFRTLALQRGQQRAVAQAGCGNRLPLNGPVAG
jgi:hypothetical protein